MAENWTWGEHSFIKPEDYSYGIPTYYDIPKVNRNNYNNGVIGDDTLEYIDGVYKNALKSGPLSYFGYKAFLPPSQAINIRMNVNSSSHLLSTMISNMMMPSIKTYKFDKNINAIIPERIYKYTPGELFNTESGYKFYISHPTESSVQFNISGLSSIYKSETLTAVEGEGGYKIFQASEFPVRNLTIQSPPATYKTNLKLGLIYTTEDISQLAVTYYSVPLIVYMPKRIESDYAVLETSVENNAFNFLSPRHEVYT